MKKIITSMMLLLCVGLFSGAMSQETNVAINIEDRSFTYEMDTVHEENNEPVRVCYNTVSKVISKKNGKVKEKNPKLEDNCFELVDDLLIVQTDSKGNRILYNIIEYEQGNMEGRLVYIIKTVTGKREQIVIILDAKLELLGVLNEEKQEVSWYYMQL